MTPIIRKFVLKLLSKDRGSGITSIPGSQHRIIKESMIIDTLIKRGVDPTKITSEGMLQSILKGIEKDKAMIARSKAEAQKGLATVMDMKGRKIKPGARIMGGEEVIETEAEIAERLGKGNKEGIERIKQKKIIEDFDPDEMASGGRVPLNEGLLVPGSKPSAEEIKEIKWKKKLGLLKKLKGGVGRRGWLNMVSEHLNDGLQEEIITKEQFNRAIMPLFGEAGETQTRALEKDDSLSMNEIMNIYGKDREDYPAYLLAGGGRAEFAHGTRKKLTKEQLKEMLNVKKPKHYKESPLAIPDDWLKRFKEKFSKADGGRARFGAGGMGRRAFLKLMAALGATGVAAKSGLVSLFGKSAGKQVAKELTQVPIKNIEGMPAWFKPLVNKVIKEGADVTKQNAFKERMVVHKTKLPDSKTDVYVNQDLDSGDVWVDIGMEKHGFADGKFGQPVRLEYKAGEVLEGPIKKGKPTKTKEEFWVEEAEFTGGHPENVKFEESTFEKFGNHESNFDEVEAFAKGKPKKVRLKQVDSSQKEAEDLADYFSNYPEPDDFASGGIAGGRVGMLWGGGIFKTIIKALAKERGVKPSYYLEVTNYKALPKEIKKYIPKADYEKMKKGRVEMFENWVEMAKTRKGFIENIEQGKKTPAAPIFEHMEKSFKSPVPRGVTDKDILQGEYVLKNLKTKGRKLNASGGLAGMLGE